MVLGHEIAGTVAQVGMNVSMIQPGARVTVMPLRLCGTCVYCRKGKPQLCDEKMLPGMGDWQGSFSDIFIAPHESTFVLGDNTSFQKGALAEQ